MGMSPYMKSLRGKIGTMLVAVPSATCVVRDDEGRFLLVRHADTGYWAVPGGAVDPTETPADAAVRELWEETGLHVRTTRLAGVFGGRPFITEYDNGDRTSYVTIVFEGEVLDGEAEVRDDELLDLRYFTADEAFSHDLVPECIREILRSVVSPDGNGVRSFKPETWAPPVACEASNGRGS